MQIRNISRFQALDARTQKAISGGIFSDYSHPLRKASPKFPSIAGVPAFGDLDGNGRMDRTCGCASMIPGCHNRFPGVAHAEGDLRRTRGSADAAFEALGASEQARAAAA